MSHNDRTEFEINLTGEAIDSASQKISEYLSGRKTERKEISGIRLTVEDILLKWKDALGEGCSVGISIGRRLGTDEIRLQCTGERCDPFEGDSDELGDWVTNLRANMESKPAYTYARHTNLVTFPLKRKSKSELLKILIFLLAGIVIGYAGRWLPAAVRTEICDNVFTPLYEAYLTLISLCGIPLIFLSIVTGIWGIGNLQTFTLLGKGFLRRGAHIVLAVTVLAVPVAILAFSPAFGQNAMAFNYGSFIELLLGGVPEGVFQPFISCNAIQLIVLSFLFGIASLVLGGSSGAFTNAVSDINAIFLKISQWMAKLIPFFVTVMTVKSMWVSEAAVLLSAWKSWVATTGAQLAFTVAAILVLTVKYRVGFLKVVKKITKTFLVAFGTDSCTASISDNYTCCVNMGVSEKIFSFGIPIGTSVFKPATAIRLVLLCFFMANVSGVSISVGWIIMLIILCVAFSVSIPAIPGGTIMFCAMLFSQLGIPTDCVSQMLATDVFFDCVCTAFNQIAVSLVLAAHAGAFDLLDTDQLKK